MGVSRGAGKRMGRRLHRRERTEVRSARSSASLIPITHAARDKLMPASDDPRSRLRRARRNRTEDAIASRRAPMVPESIVNASRSLMYAYLKNGGKPAEAAAAYAETMRRDLNTALEVSRRARTSSAVL